MFSGNSHSVDCDIVNQFSRTQRGQGEWNRMQEGENSSGVFGSHTGKRYGENEEEASYGLDPLVRLLANEENETDGMEEGGTYLKDAQSSRGRRITRSFEHYTTVSEVDMEKEDAIVELFFSLDEDRRFSVLDRITKDKYGTMHAKKSAMGAAFSRFPALFITLVIELMAGVVIARYERTLKEIVLLTSFMPVISAISGNVGLQSATIAVRSIATGQLGSGINRSALWKEIRTCLYLSVVAGFVVLSVGWLWSGWLLFGVVVGLAIAVSMTCAGFMGCISPHFFKYVGIDPATCVGPFETAFQDVIGYALFLAVADVILSSGRP
eukprot:Nk52_evm22s287 gene=Nk52_evmTU22s287